MREVVQARHDQAAQDAEEQRPEYDTIAALHRKREDLRGIETAVASLRHRRSNLDEDLLALRTRISQAAGVDEEDLPFAGELLQVRRDRRDWEPAVQRLLRGFGTTLLVPEAAYPVVSEWVDATNLRSRLTYQAVPAETRPAGRPTPGTLPEVLDIAPASPMAEWLGGEVMRRFRSIALAESVAAFRSADQAITKQGQVKRPGRVHEKDDRYVLGDRRRYVLGWDNRDKVATLDADAEGLCREIDDAGEVARGGGGPPASVAEGDERGRHAAAGVRGLHGGGRRRRPGEARGPASGPADAAGRVVDAGRAAPPEGQGGGGARTPREQARDGRRRHRQVGAAGRPT